MDYYTPIFSKIVNSSLWTEPDYVCKLFLTMLALKDNDFVVRHNAYALGKICWPKELEGGVAERRAIDALAVLSNPDTSRIEPQPFDGRRIQQVSGGWMILNGKHYHDKAREVNRRIAASKRQQKYMAKKKLALEPSETFETAQPS